MNLFSYFSQENINLSTAVISALSSIIGSILAWIALGPHWEQKQKQKELKKAFGLDFFPPNSIERFTRY